MVRQPCRKPKACPHMKEEAGYVQDAAPSPGATAANGRGGRSYFALGAGEAHIGASAAMHVWLVNARVSTALILGCGGMMLASALGGPNLTVAAGGGVPLWKHLLASLFCDTAPLIAATVYYRARVLERTLGSRRYAALLCVLVVVTRALHIAASLGAGISRLVPGTYFLTALALLHTQRNELVLPYITDFMSLFLPMLFFRDTSLSGPLSVAAPLTIGALSSILVSPLVRHLAFPRGLSSTIDSAFDPLFAILEGAATPRTRAGATGAAGAGAARQVAVSEEHVQTLVAMGFSADRAREALAMAGNNVDAALEILLAQM
eukprot:m.228840 g.228840  ORF g.228840 m.228840 type:complete len:320 (-) comp10856_c0_seq29:5482-6441(-)